MSWIDVAWPMMAAMCLTLALITLLVWLRQRSRLDYLAFCVLGICVALFAAGEWNLMRADSPQRYGDVLRWMAELGLDRVEPFVTVAAGPHFHYRAAKSRDRVKLEEYLYRQRLRRVDKLAGRAPETDG